MESDVFNRACDTHVFFVSMVLSFYKIKDHDIGIIYCLGP